MRGVDASFGLKFDPTAPDGETALCPSAVARLLLGLLVPPGTYVQSLVTLYRTYVVKPVCKD